MKYRIGEIANLLNLSPQALRNYEAEGLVHPQKDESSAYRYYSGWDLILLSACRQYRTLDFSLQETNRLLTCESPEEVLNFLSRHETELDRLIEEYKQKRDTVAAWRKQLEQSARVQESFHIEDSVDTYCLVYQQEDRLLQDGEMRALLSEWYGYIPYAYCSIQLPIADYPENIHNYSVGLCVAAEAVPFLGIEDTSRLFHMPARRCLCTTTVIDQESFESGKIYENMVRYAREHHLTLDEKEVFFCRLNLICKEESGLRFFVDCFAPLINS